MLWLCGHKGYGCGNGNQAVGDCSVWGCWQQAVGQWVIGGMGFSFTICLQGWIK